MNNTNKKFRGEKRIGKLSVRVIETIDGQYFITIEKKGLFGTKMTASMVLDTFDEAIKVFNAIF